MFFFYIVYQNQRWLRSWTSTIAGEAKAKGRRHKKWSTSCVLHDSHCEKL